MLVAAQNVLPLVIALQTNSANKIAVETLA